MGQKENGSEREKTRSLVKLVFGAFLLENVLRSALSSLTMMTYHNFIATNMWFR